jgi:hypothetical protein
MVPSRSMSFGKWGHDEDQSDLLFRFDIPVSTC